MSGPDPACGTDDASAGERIGTTGTLVLVATPIGNLGDLAPRAVEVLGSADLICCEDTRRTRGLLTHAGVHGRTLLALHDHNERSQTPRVLQHLAAGALVALVSDAGMPGLSDPGGWLVSQAAAAGHAVSVVPGPSAGIAALVVSGLPAARYCFEGFLPRRGADRRLRLTQLAAEERTTVVHEAPGRLAATLVDVARFCGTDRLVAVVREITKIHEEVWRGTAGAAAEEFGRRAAAGNQRGEVVIVICGVPADHPVPGDREVEAALGAQLEGGASVRDAAGAVAAGLGVPRRRAYTLALRIVGQGAGSTGAGDAGRAGRSGPGPGTGGSSRATGRQGC